MSPDTLSIDTARVAAWSNQPDYAYRSQLYRPENNWIDSIIQELLDKLNDWTVNAYEWTGSEILGILFFLLVVVVAAFWLYRHRQEWKRREGKSGGRLDYTVTDDNIYGVDFEEAIAQALQTEDFDEVARLVYLQELHRLNGAGRIAWRRGLTPETYFGMLPEGEDLQRLRRLTAQYLRIRFGHYRADRELANQLLRMRAAEITQKGGSL